MEILLLESIKVLLEVLSNLTRDLLAGWQVVD